MGDVLVDPRLRRLWAQAAEARDLARRADARRLSAEHAVSEYERAERIRPLLDVHPSAAPSPEGLAEWEAICARMRESVNEPTWRVWCEPVHPHRRLDGVWVLACPASLRGWIVERFGRLWERACWPDREVDGTGVRFVICQPTSERSTE